MMKMARSNRIRNHGALLSPVDHFLIFCLLSAFPLEWRRGLKLHKASIYANTQHQIPSDFFLWVDGTKTSLEKLNSKSLYESFVSKISYQPTEMKKYDSILNRHRSSELEEDLFTPFQSNLAYQVKGISI